MVTDDRRSSGPLICRKFEKAGLYGIGPLPHTGISDLKMPHADLEQFVRAMPKVELHAHINGSISQGTIQKLIDKKKQKDPSWKIEGEQTSLKSDEKGNYEDCFAMFRLIHQLSDDEDAMYMITYDVIHEFSEDNVKYLELRTTPRGNPATGMTKKSYINSVLRAIRDCAAENLDIQVNLILAIDRRNSVQEAEDTVKLAHEYRQSDGCCIVGIDLSGLPLAGDARHFIPVFQDAREKGLKLALHLSEAPGQNTETQAVLEQIPPDRLGHGVFLHPDCGGTQRLVDLMEQHRIPLELCLTSNVKGGVVSDYDQHHFQHWFTKNHPIIICTDDKGVFSTSLSEEYLITARVFNLSADQIWQLSHSGIDSIFAGDEVKDTLRAKWKLLKKSLFPG